MQFGVLRRLRTRVHESIGELPYRVIIPIKRIAGVTPSTPAGTAMRAYELASCRACAYAIGLCADVSACIQQPYLRHWPGDSGRRRSSRCSGKRVARQQLQQPPQYQTQMPQHMI